MNRRRLLRLAAAGVTPGVAAGLAGCAALADLRSAVDGQSTDAESAPTAASGPDPDAPASSTDLPYDDGPPVTPRGLSVRNVAPTTQYVTVAVETEGGERLFVTSESLGGRRVVGYDGLVAAAGAYRVVVETAGGDRAETTWRVTESAGDLAVTVGDGVTIQQTVRCAPDCGLARGGTAVGYPAGDFDPRGRRDDTTLRVVNPADGTATTTRIRVGTDDRPVLDYRYDHPAGVTIELPVPQYAGDLPVTITAGDRERRFDWRPQVTPSLRAVLADGVQFRCGVGNRDLQVVNPDDGSSEVAVRVFPASGDETETDRAAPLFAERYTVPASSSVESEEVVASAGRYRVEVAVDDAATGDGATAGAATGGETTAGAATDDGATAGETVEATWVTCPPRGPLVVVVSETGVSSIRVGGNAVTTNPVGR